MEALSAINLSSHSPHTGPRICKIHGFPLGRWVTVLTRTASLFIENLQEGSICSRLSKTVPIFCKPHIRVYIRVGIPHISLSHMSLPWWGLKLWHMRAIFSLLFLQPNILNKEHFELVFSRRYLEMSGGLFTLAFLMLSPIYFALTPSSPHLKANQEGEGLV